MALPVGLSTAYRPLATGVEQAVREALERSAHPALARQLRALAALELPAEDRVALIRRTAAAFQPDLPTDDLLPVAGRSFSRAAWRAVDRAFGAGAMDYFRLYAS